MNQRDVSELPIELLAETAMIIDRTFGGIADLPPALGEIIFIEPKRKGGPSGGEGLASPTR